MHYLSVFQVICYEENVFQLYNTQQRIECKSEHYDVGSTQALPKGINHYKYSRRHISLAQIYCDYISQDLWL